MTSINHSLNRNQSRIARMLLVLFLMAWANLIYQAPVHAAMKIRGEMPCHGDYTLCDTVLAMQDQADDGLAGTLPVVGDIALVFQLLPAMRESSAIDQCFHLAEFTFHDTSPPPLSRTGILRI